MARPIKLNASYFSHDADMRNNKKIKLLRIKYGHDGYSIWCMILEMLTNSEYFEMDYTPKDILFMSYDLDSTNEEIEGIVEYCIELGLLVKSEDGTKIYSPSLKKRLNEVLEKKRRQSEGGKAGMAIRYNKSDTSNLQDTCRSDTSNLEDTNKLDITKEKKTKEEEIEENEKEKKKKVEGSVRDAHETSPKARFTVPSIDEVKAYIQEKGYDVDAEAFVAFYESKGWKVGNQPMKSWKAAIVTWMKRHGKKDMLEERKRTLVQDDSLLGRLNRWLLNNVPYIVGHFETLLTEEQYDHLLKKYGSGKLTETIMDLENRHDMCDKYSNLNTTLINWLEKDGSSE